MLDKEYNKTIKFGKIAYNGQKTATNLVELELTLKIEDNKAIFSAMGGVWNASYTDYITCGQMIDEVWKEFSGQLEMPSLYKKIMGLWKKWHLNDMHAGCIHQRKFESEPYEKHEKAYCKKCKYTYGSDWKYQAIDKIDLKEICILLDIPFLEMMAIGRLRK